jgi:transcriptional regulator with XRE-family HTH domain
MIVRAKYILRLRHEFNKKGEPMYVQAAGCRITPTDFSRIMRGILEPSYDQMERIADYYGQDEQYLFYHGEEE